MNVVVNGREVALPEASTVAVLLDELGIAGPYALVERNGRPVERELYDELELDEGDDLIVARPVAGG